MHPQQYWADDTRAYRFVPVAEFARAFEESATGRAALSAASEAIPLAHAPHSKLDPLVRQRCAQGCCCFERSQATEFVTAPGPSL